MKTLVGITRAGAIGAVIGWSIAGFWSFQDQFELAANITGLVVMAILAQWALKAAK